MEFFVLSAGNETAARSPTVDARPELLEAARPGIVLAPPHAKHGGGPHEVWLRRGDGALGSSSAVLTATDEFRAVSFSLSSRYSFRSCILIVGISLFFVDI